MSTISQWAVYQMCRTLDNNYSYILKIVKDVYPELYSESPTYDWERKSILGYFHKNFSKLLEESTNESAKEALKEKPFQWSNWKEQTDNEILVIDLTRRIPTNWKIYRLYRKNEGNCLDMLDSLKEKYPDFALPDDWTEDDLGNVIRQIYEKVQMVIDSGCKKDIKKQKEIPFTWESNEIEMNIDSGCKEQIEKQEETSVTWESNEIEMNIDSGCKEQIEKQEETSVTWESNEIEMNIDSGCKEQIEKQEETSVTWESNEIEMNIDNGCKEQIEKQEETSVTLESKEIERNSPLQGPSTEVKESSSKTPTNWDIYELCKQHKCHYKYIIQLLQKSHPDLYSHSKVTVSQLYSKLQMTHRKISHIVRNNQSNEVAKEKKTLFTWCNEGSNNKNKKPFSTKVKESSSNNLTNWEIYKLCRQRKCRYKYIIQLLLDVHPDLYSHSEVNESQLYSKLQMTHRKISHLVRNNQSNEVAKEKKTLFTWCNEGSNNKDTKPLSTEVKESSSKTPTNWDIYELCKQHKCHYKYIIQLLQKNHPDLYSHSEVNESQLYSKLQMTHRKISHLVRNNQSNEVAKEKKTLFTWCNEGSNNKDTKPFSADVDLNETEAPVREETINEETSIDSVPVDDLFSTASPPHSPNLNSNSILPVSQPQSPIEATATAAAASPSANQDLPNDPEDKDLILAIKKFENLISGTMTEIAAKDAKIEYLRKEINNVTKYQKKVSSNLKRLQYQQLSKKLST